jgi:hypothetical protein
MYYSWRATIAKSWKAIRMNLRRTAPFHLVYLCTKGSTHVAQKYSVRQSEHAKQARDHVSLCNNGTNLLVRYALSLGEAAICQVTP